jgi:hypothetical protein
LQLQLNFGTLFTLTVTVSGTTLSGTTLKVTGGVTTEIGKEIPPREMRARFSSLAELLADMHTKDGRDPFAANLAKNHGSIPDPSRKEKKGDNNGLKSHNLPHRLENICRTN